MAAIFVAEVFFEHARFRTGADTLQNKQARAAQGRERVPQKRTWIQDAGVDATGHKLFGHGV